MLWESGFRWKESFLHYIFTEKRIKIRCFLQWFEQNKLVPLCQKTVIVGWCISVAPQCFIYNSVFFSQEAHSKCLTQEVGVFTRKITAHKQQITDITGATVWVNSLSWASRTLPTKPTHHRAGLGRSWVGSIITLLWHILPSWKKLQLLRFGYIWIWLQ